VCSDTERRLGRGETPCLTASDDAGFEVDEAEVVYWGRCPACRSEALTEAGATTGA
jgi:Fur family transcriptional regulator, stress-responsive regulator